MRIEPTSPAGAQGETHRRGPGDAPLDWQQQPEQTELPETLRGKTFAEILALMMQAQASTTEVTATTATEPPLHPVQLDILHALQGGAPPPNDSGIDPAHIAALYAQTVARDTEPPAVDTQG